MLNLTLRERLPLLSTLISHDYFFKIQQNDLAYAGENVMQILIFSQQYKLEYGLLLQYRFIGDIPRECDNHRLQHTFFKKLLVIEVTQKDYKR